MIWNARWAAASTLRGRATIELFEALEPDIVCITEGTAGLHPAGGHVTVSQPDYGYAAPPIRRKVILWSRYPWIDVDEVGAPQLPGGRFVSGMTRVAGIPIRVVGVCVPWCDAHVRTGRRDSKPWDQHLEYLKHLGGVVDGLATGVPLILGGDFNQRVPRRREPARVAAAMTQALTGMHLVTSGCVPGVDRQLIDHVAVCGGLSVRAVHGISRVAGDIELSDHDGVAVDLETVR